MFFHRQESVSTRYDHSDPEGQPNPCSHSQNQIAIHNFHPVASQKDNLMELSARFEPHHESHITLHHILQIHLLGKQIEHLEMNTYQFFQELKEAIPMFPHHYAR